MSHEHSAHDHPFYDVIVFRDREQEYINKILKKYQKEEPTEELRKKIWDDLQKEKHLKHITIPFKVVLRRDSYGKYPPYIEVILDTKV